MLPCLSSQATCSLVYSFTCPLTLLLCLSLQVDKLDEFTSKQVACYKGKDLVLMLLCLSLQFLCLSL